MAGLNKATLIGNLGRDPEVRNVQGGDRIKVTFSLATTKTYNDREGQRVTQTEWHNIVLWSPIAEIAEKYLRKGRQVYIEGEIMYRSYQDQEGHTKNITEIVGRNMVLLGNRSDTTQEETPAPKPTATPSSPSSTSLQEDELPF